MTIGKAVAERIKQLYTTRGITLNKLATDSGITQSTLNNIVCGTSNNPTISTIKKVCDGMGMGIVEFFDADIFSNLEQEVQ